MAAKKKSKRTATRGDTARNRMVVESAVIVDESGKLRAVERAVDTVELLYRRQQIDHRQRQAAQLYRDAAEACRGAIPCALDMSRVRGSGAASASPTEAQLLAAERLAEAGRILGFGDSRLVGLIVCEGWSIQKAAVCLFGDRRGDAEHAGRRFRTALDALADAWVPLRRAATIRAHRAPAVEQAATVPVTPGTIERALAAHATGCQVFYM